MCAGPTTIALLVGCGAAAVNPIWPWGTVGDLVRSGVLTGVTGDQSVKEPHQGARQGRAEGDVQDGHQHRRLYRGTGRGGRPACVAGAGSTLFHGTISQLGGVGLDAIAAERGAARHSAYPPEGVRLHRTASWRSAAIPMAPRGEPTSST